MSELDAGLLDRDGRPTQLALARLHAGELEPEQAALLRATLDEDDQRELEALDAIDLRPPPALFAAAAEANTTKTETAAPIPLRPRRWTWLGGAASLAAAAAAVLWLRTPDPDNPELRDDPPKEEFRTKGADFDLQLWIDDGQRNYRASEGELVRGGDKIAFEVAPRVDGHLVVLCVDPSGAAARCHPLERPFEALSARGDTLMIVPGLAFDDAPGEERFIGLLCRDPVELDAVLADPDHTPGGCLRDEVRVRKAEPK